jgi:3-hydroxyisobutyrate dehydrogenase
MKIAFIGLGVMGFPMAGHLARAGHELCVHNRTATKSAAWIARHPGRSAPTPADAAAGADLVLTCVTDDRALRDVVTGPAGALAAMRDGAILIDHSSASPSIARELAALTGPRGIRSLDAPVTGGAIGAERGELGIMVGGEPAALAQAGPALHAYAAQLRWMGPAGAGHLSKLVNVIIAAGTGQAVAEGIGFARSAGLDLPTLLEVLAQGSSRSWVLEHKAPAMVEGRYRQGSFSVDLILKDIGTARAEAAHYGLDLPLLDLLERQYRTIGERGGGSWDSTALVDLVSGTPARAVDG